MPSCFKTYLRFITQKCVFWDEHDHIIRIILSDVRKLLERQRRPFWLTGCLLLHVSIRALHHTFLSEDTFTRTVVRLNLLTTVAVFLTFSASDVGFELFVSSQPVAPSGKTWRSCSQSSWVWGNSWGFVSAPQCRCSLSTDAAAAEDDRCSSLRSPHDSSICCMHSDRLPLIHLKNFVVLYVYTVYQVNFGNLWCLTLYRTRISACTAAHSKMFFI